MVPGKFYGVNGSNSGTLPPPLKGSKQVVNLCRFQATSPCWVPFLSQWRKRLTSRLEKTGRVPGKAK